MCCRGGSAASERHSVNSTSYIRTTARKNSGTSEMNVLDLISFLRVRPTSSVPLLAITGDGPAKVRGPLLPSQLGILANTDPDQLASQNASQRQMSRKVKQSQDQPSNGQGILWLREAFRINRDLPRIVRQATIGDDAMTRCPESNAFQSTMRLKTNMHKSRDALER